MKKEFEESVLNTTCHGIPHLMRSKSLILRTIWIVSTVASVCGCSYLITKSIIDYLSFSVVSNIRVVYDNNPIFPMVTICRQDRLVTKESRNYLMKYLNKTEEEMNNIKNNDTFDAFINILNNFTEEDKMKMGYNVSEIIIECRFNRLDCNKEQDFVAYFDSQCGVCYRFNSGFDQFGHKVELKRTIYPGADYGLNLVVNELNENIMPYTNLFNSE
jgi:hypothetical protein